MLDGSSVGTTVEVVIYSSVIIFVFVRATNEAIRVTSQTFVDIQVGGYTTVLNVIQGHRYSTQAVLSSFGFFTSFVFSNEGFSAFEAVQGNRFYARVFTSQVSISQVVVTEDTGRGIVVIFPLVLFFVPIEFLTQSREAATDTDETVGCSCAVFHVSRSCRCVCFTTHTTSTGELVFESSFLSGPPNEAFTITLIFSVREATGYSSFSRYSSARRSGSSSVKIEVFTIFVSTSDVFGAIIPFCRINNSSYFSSI